MDETKRCVWPNEKDDLMIEYHDKEWGTPCHDDGILFEYFLLDTFQAGLSWRTILHKRENFRKAFGDFNPIKISKYTEEDVMGLMNNAGIIRNRLKILSTITNSQKFLEIQKEFETFDKYIWQFTNHKTINSNFKKHEKIPAKTKESDAMEKDLRKRGFKFIGSTICYAFMQGAGMTNDHLVECFRHGEIDDKHRKNQAK